MINLRTFDLNLLVIFEAVVSERHITRAAKRLNVTQPAITIALNRLRSLLGDEIVIRTSSGMMPTKLALSYLEPVQAILKDIDRLICYTPDFDPKLSRRTFRVRMSDILAAIVLPDLSRLFRSQAPNCILEIVRLEPAAIAKNLEQGVIDLALGVNVEHAKSISAASLLSDRFIAVRGSHAFDGETPMSAQEFSKLPQLRIAHDKFDTGFSDAILSCFEGPVHNAVDAPQWLAAGSILEATDLVLVASQRFAQIICRNYDVAAFDIPMETPSIDWRLYWHRRDDQDAGSLWLRSALQEIALRLSCMPQVAYKQIV